MRARLDPAVGVDRQTDKMICRRPSLSILMRACQILS